jgi:hypothetical protein
MNMRGEEMGGGRAGNELTTCGQDGCGDGGPQATTRQRELVPGLQSNVPVLSATETCRRAASRPVQNCVHSNSNTVRSPTVMTETAPDMPACGGPPRHAGHAGGRAVGWRRSN